MLTIQIITNNNANTIEKTLESIDEIEAEKIVIDTGSKDRTLDICRKFNIKIDNYKKHLGEDVLVKVYSLDEYNILKSRATDQLIEANNEIVKLKSVNNSNTSIWPTLIGLVIATYGVLWLVKMLNL